MGKERRGQERRRKGKKKEGGRPSEFVPPGKIS